MRKIILFSLFLILGLCGSQLLPNLVGLDSYASCKGVTDTLLYICLAFIMINVGREFEVDKTRWRSYVSDYFIAMATAALPWILVALYYVFVLLPIEYAGNFNAWKESLLLSRFAAPTSAGILFAMLAAIGLGSSWIYKKIQVLAIFDDLDTILLMIPLQIMMVGLKWEMLAILIIVTILLTVGWKRLDRYDIRQEWWAITLYAVLIFGMTWIVNVLFGIHVEILLPAFVLGMVIKNRHIHNPVDANISNGISFIFMLLVGFSMPCFLGSAGSIFTSGCAEDASILGNQPMISWGMIMAHVLIVTLLSNIGKLVPLFFYKERKMEERLALSIGMFTRGEVGAGIIFIAVGYNIGGPALIISVLTLALNLILTGIFVLWVKQLALKAYRDPDAAQKE